MLLGGTAARLFDGTDPMSAAAAGIADTGGVPGAGGVGDGDEEDWPAPDAPVECAPLLFAIIVSPPYD